MFGYKGILRGWYVRVNSRSKEYVLEMRKHSSPVGFPKMFLLLLFLTTMLLHSIRGPLLCPVCFSPPFGPSSWCLLFLPFSSSWCSLLLTTSPWHFPLYEERGWKPYLLPILLPCWQSSILIFCPLMALLVSWCPFRFYPSLSPFPFSRLSKSIYFLAASN